MTLLDSLMSESHLPLDQALATPVRQALCLYSIAALRHGWVWAGPSYAQRDLDS